MGKNYSVYSSSDLLSVSSISVSAGKNVEWLERLSWAEATDQSNSAIGRALTPLGVYKSTLSYMCFSWGHWPQSAWAREPSIEHTFTLPSLISEEVQQWPLLVWVTFELFFTSYPIVKLIVHMVWFNNIFINIVWVLNLGILIILFCCIASVRSSQLSNSSHTFALNGVSTVKDGSLGEFLAWEEGLGWLSPLY